MPQTRKIKRIFKSKAVIEGAGVRLKRALGFGEVPMFDPFLLLDDFRSNNPGHYLKGFPWHPHRGIETISYVLRGEVEHGDSMKNRGVIGPGDVQWMTAGSGIIHQEMPRGDAENYMEGFQLWANLPASEKMMAPRYREVKSADIPEVEMPGGVKVKIIAGKLAGATGPVRDVVTDPEYMDINIPPETEYVHKTISGHTVFAYVIGGNGYFDKEKSALLENENLVLFEDGEEIVISTGGEGIRLLFVSGKPLNEPVAWQGPIVMNTQEELRTAFEEYENGTFIKHE